MGSRYGQSDKEFYKDLAKVGTFIVSVILMIYAGESVQEKYFRENPTPHAPKIVPKEHKPSNTALDDYFDDKKSDNSGSDTDQLGKTVEKKNEVMCDSAPITDCVKCPGETNGECKKKSIGFFRKYVKESLKQTFYNEKDDDLFMKMLDGAGFDKEAVKKYANDSKQYESCVTDKDSCPANLRRAMPEEK